MSLLLLNIITVLWWWLLLLLLDKQIRLFDFSKGKLIRKYDESVAVYNNNSRYYYYNYYKYNCYCCCYYYSSTSGMDSLDLGRRQAMERVIIIKKITTILSLILLLGVRVFSGNVFFVQFSFWWKWKFFIIRTTLLVTTFNTLMTIITTTTIIKIIKQLYQVAI